MGSRLRTLLPDAAPRVAAVMQPKVAALDAGAPLARLVPLLRDGRYHQVVITGKNGKVAGVVSRSDLLAALCEQLLEAA